MSAPKSDLVLVAYRKDDKPGHHRARGRIIKWWSRAKYSHTELVFPDGMSFSSSGLDDGVRWKRINYSHEDWWDFVAVPWLDTNEKIHQLRIQCDMQKGKKYDFFGLVFYLILPFKRQKSNKWWCSELTAFVLKFKPFRITPGKHYKMHRKKGGYHVFPGGSK